MFRFYLGCSWGRMVLAAQTEAAALTEAERYGRERGLTVFVAGESADGIAMLGKIPPCLVTSDVGHLLFGDLYLPPENN